MCSSTFSLVSMVSILQFYAITLVVPLIFTFIAIDGLLIASSSRIPVIPCQIADFLAVHALCSAQAIMVKLALVAQWKSSSILLPFTSLNGISKLHLIFNTTTANVEYRFHLLEPTGQADNTFHSLEVQRHDSSKSRKNNVSMVLRVMLQKVKCCEMLHGKNEYALMAKMET
nr:hypothetical protein [Tanacetum cinerariifolium]